MFDFDLIIIGGGSGGLVAASVARQLGAKVALIDKERLGGECLYTGCVPSKTLIHIAKVAQIVRSGEARGVLSATPTIAMPQVAAAIAGVIDQIGHDESAYVEGVDVRFGVVRFIDPHTLDLAGTRLTTKSVIIATGSHAAIPTIAGLDGIAYLTNESVFALNALPTSLAIVGGGPEGCELAQAFARLGTTVTLLQRAERVLPREEPMVSQSIAAALTADGVTIITGANITGITRAGEMNEITYTAPDKIAATMHAAAILFATGRSPNVQDLDLERAGVRYTAAGITVDDKMRTAQSNIFAIGDVTGGYHFTHIAAAEAGVAAPNALLPAFLARKMSYAVVPWATFTDPEAARIGLTETEARARFGNAVRVQLFPWSHIDRAQTDGKPVGFIKLVIGKGETLLGAHLVGAHSSELLAELALVMRHKLPISDITATIHTYPTYSTGLQSAAFAANIASPTWARNRSIVKRFLPRR